MDLHPPSIIHIHSEAYKNNNKKKASGCPDRSKHMRFKQTLRVTNRHSENCKRGVGAGFKDSGKQIP